MSSVLRRKYQWDMWEFCFFSKAGLREPVLVPSGPGRTKLWDMGRMGNHDIKELFRMLAANTKGALAESLLAALIDGYGDELAVKIRYYLANDERLVEEALRDVFIEVWRKRRELGAIDNPIGWLGLLCRNKAVDTFRQEDKLGKGQIPWPDEYLDYPDSHPLFDELVYRDYLGLIKDALEHLPEQQRTVYVMNKLDDLSISGIANLLKLKEQTVKNHLQLAQQALRARLGYLWKEGLK